LSLSGIDGSFPKLLSPLIKVEGFSPNIGKDCGPETLESELEVCFTGNEVENGDGVKEKEGWAVALAVSDVNDVVGMNDRLGPFAALFGKEVALDVDDWEPCTWAMAGSGTVIAGFAFSWDVTFSVFAGPVSSRPASPFQVGGGAVGNTDGSATVAIGACEEELVGNFRAAPDELLCKGGYEERTGASFVLT
jgi:hypothetical protein